MIGHEILIRRPDGVLLMRREQKGERLWREDHSYKFLYAPAGTIRYQTGSGKFTLAPGHFIVLNPLQRHQQLGFDHTKLLIELPYAFVNEVADQLGFVQERDVLFALQVQRHPQLTRWVQFIQDHLAAHQGEHPAVVGLFLDHALVQLAMLLLSHGVGSHRTELAFPPSKGEQALLAKAIDAMKESYTEPWTLEEMAGTVHLSKYRFARLFKETLGISPYAWLQLYRLVRSQERLKKTDDSIAEIALSSGFSSVAAYNQLFKRVYAVSPGAFRKRYR
jgi:AraC-like DNA-binding protein